MKVFDNWLESYKKEIKENLEETKRLGKADPDVLDLMAAMLKDMKIQVHTKGGHENMARRKNYQKGKEKRNIPKQSTQKPVTTPVRGVLDPPIL